MCPFATANFGVQHLPEAKRRRSKFLNSHSDFFFGTLFCARNFDASAHWCTIFKLIFFFACLFFLLIQCVFLRCSFSSAHVISCAWMPCVWEDVALIWRKFSAQRWKIFIFISAPTTCFHQLISSTSFCIWFWKLQIKQNHRYVLCSSTIKALRFSITNHVQYILAPVGNFFSGYSRATRKLHLRARFGS